MACHGHMISLLISVVLTCVPFCWFKEGKKESWAQLCEINEWILSVDSLFLHVVSQRNDVGELCGFPFQQSDLLNIYKDIKGENTQEADYFDLAWKEL